MLFYRAALPLSARPHLSVRDHPPPPCCDWLGLAEAELWAAGSAGARLPAERQYVRALIPIDRVAADWPFYSGKHEKHGMNLQVITSPDGDIPWVSGALPGPVHDKKAEWIWGVLAELEAVGLVTLADKGPAPRLPEARAPHPRLCPDLLVRHPAHPRRRMDT
jgi:hypothetical protein